jgi:cyclic pyranopterin phosphate synthase
MAKQRQGQEWKSTASPPATASSSPPAATPAGTTPGEPTAGPGGLTHLSETGSARMVDVGGKPVTARRAVAGGYIAMRPGTLRAIADEKVPKGEVLNTARVAGILAAKRCGELIPLCHPLPIESVEVDFDLPELEPADPDAPVRLYVKAAASITAKTGVEMEALTAVAVAALTVYDMCKAIDKTMVIGDVKLLSKTGGTKEGVAE